MKYIKTFESYSVNEEFLGTLAAIAGIGAVFAAGAIYDGIKKGYSKYVTGNNYNEASENLNISDVISSFEGMRRLRKDEIKRGKKVYIKGDDGRGYLLTIVSGDFYRDEDTELAETEAHYYQDKGELYVYELKKFVMDFPNYSLRPEPVDFIYVKNIDNEISGEY